MEAFEWQLVMEEAGIQLFAPCNWETFLSTRYTTYPLIIRLYLADWDDARP